MDNTGAKASNPRCPLNFSVIELVEIPGAALIYSVVSKGALALALLVTRVRLADHHDVSIAADNAAVVADGLDAGVDLHVVSLHSLSS